jgi:hypothetical protein
MPKATESDEETLQTIIAPFYRAVGKASARWQHVVCFRLSLIPKKIGPPPGV